MSNICLATTMLVVTQRQREAGPTYYKAKIIHGRYDRSFRYRHNACSLPSSWNSICEETRIKYNAKNVSKLFSACLKYSWCNVTWASGFVGIHMLKHMQNLVLTCIEPLKVILLNRLVRHHQLKDEILLFKIIAFFEIFYFKITSLLLTFQNQ